MKRGAFTLDGVSSESIGLYLQDRPDLEVPSRRIEMKTAYGLSGDIPYDEEGADGEEVYDNTSMSLTLLALANGKTASENRAIISNFFTSKRYMEMIPYFDESKSYNVMLDPTTKLTLSNKWYFDEIMIGSATLTVKPWKHYTNVATQTLTASGSINNPYLKSSLPRIKIYGSGDVTLKIGTVSFVVKNIVDNIIIDTELMYGYKESSAGVITNENSKLYSRTFPKLLPGANAISWSGTGTVTKIEIEPRWRTLA